MRSQIFRQITQKFRRQTVWSQFILVRHSFVLEQNPASNAVVWQGISGQYDGKSARRLRAKPSGVLYSVFPYIQEQANISVRLHICIVLRQYRTKIVRQMRCQIFRQMKQKAE